jgi:hypothetical protein
MPRNKIEDLRNHLFETLEMLKDGEIEVEKAQVICQVADVIVNSAKVEVQFLRAMGTNQTTGFMQLENKEK